MNRDVVQDSAALRLRHPETKLLEPSALLRPGPQHRTGCGLGQALPPPCRVPGAQGAGGLDSGLRHRRSTGRCPQAAEIGTPRFGRPTGDWGLIQGELVTFIDPQRDLPLIDRMEGFGPGGHSMYQRVIVAVLCERASIPAWTYWMPRI